jgi:hypothetical protein
VTRRLTIRTLTVSALIVVIVAGVLGGLTLAIDRQHDAGERARRSPPPTSPSSGCWRCRPPSAAS